MNIKRFFSRLYRISYSVRETNFWIIKPRFSHVTYCIAGNSGDTALSKCVRDIFRQRIRHSSWNMIRVTHVISDNTIKRINKTQALIIGGGGLFLPDTNFNMTSGWQWPISKKQLRKIEAPIIVFSVGYNYFRGQELTDVFRDNIKELVALSAFVGLRNRGSVKKIQELAEPQHRNKIIYQPCITTLIRKNYKLPPKKKSNQVALNMAFDRIELRLGKEKDEILKQVAVGMGEISELGFEIVYVAHMQEDLQFIPYLQDAGVRFRIVDTSRWLPLKLFHFYNEIELVLGMRGHAQMIPFGVNCKIITLGSHEKMKWFLEDIQALDWYIELGKDPSSLKETIVNRFIDVQIEHGDKTYQRLIDQQEILYRLTQTNMNKIHTIIREQGGI